MIRLKERNRVGEMSKIGYPVGCCAAAAMLVALFATNAQANDKVRVGTPEAAGFSFAGPDVGNEAGIFKKYGLDVERIDFAGGAKVHQAMNAGAVDVIVGTGSDMLFLTKGAPERGVAAFGNDLASLSLVVRDDDKIKKDEDLKGKIIASSTTGSFTSWIALTILKQHGITADQVTVAYLGSQSGLYAGLTAKSADAIVGTTARVMMPESKGRFRALANAGDEIQNFIANVIYASEPMMKEHPDTLRRFLAAWFETMRYMKDHKADTVKITQRSTQLPDEAAAIGYDIEMPYFFMDGHFDRKKLAAVKQSLIDLGLTDKTAPDEDLITEAFLP